MKIHPRTQLVQGAMFAICAELFTMIDKHGLTLTEAMKIMAYVQGEIAKYLLRAERHPDDPSRKADEE